MQSLRSQVRKTHREEDRTGSGSPRSREGSGGVTPAELLLRQRPGLPVPTFIIRYSFFYPLSEHVSELSADYHYITSARRYFAKFHVVSDHESV
jgi:hypothetical protein